MADQLNGSMGNLSLDGGPPPGQHPGQQPGARSYIPPHMRGKMATNGPPANGPPMGGPPMNGPGPAPAPGPAPGSGPAPMNGLNNSAWAG